MSEGRLVAAWGELLLRPVDDGGLEEAAAAQLEEGHQVPQHAQAADTAEQSISTAAGLGLKHSGSL